MRHRLSVLRLLSAAFVALLAVGTTQAEDPLAIVRVESLDTLNADLETVMEAIGGNGPATSSLLQGMVAGSIGAKDLSFVHPRRPIVMVFPQQALMLGTSAALAALPIDTDADALAAFGLSADAQADEQGLHAFAMGESRAYLRFDDGYVLVGSSPSLLAAFDPSIALSASDLPPGAIAIDIDFEPIAPMALMGLNAASTMLEDGSLPGSEGDDPSMPPEATKAASDFIFPVFKDLLANMSRLQMSIDLEARNLAVHGRVIPRSGSSLESFINAQADHQRTDLTRLIQPGDDDTMRMVLDVKVTPEARETLGGYISAMFEMVTAIGGDEDGGLYGPQLMGMLNAASDSAEDIVRCMRGDTASVSTIGEDGIEVAQVIGLLELPGCAEIPEKLLASMATETRGKASSAFEANTFVHRGVKAHRQTTDLEGLYDGMEGVDSKALEEMIGEGASGYQGVAGTAWITTGGQDAETTFREIVDAYVDGKSPRGLAGADFGGLPDHPGLRMTLDLSAVIEMGVAASAADTDVPAPADASLGFGVLFHSGMADSRILVPLALLEWFGQMVGAEAETQPERPRDES